jgi:hypothetical protein
MSVDEFDNRAPKEFGTCHFASLADVINPFQQIVRQTKGRKAIIHRWFFIAHAAELIVVMLISHSVLR